MTPFEEYHCLTYYGFGDGTQLARRHAVGRAAEGPLDACSSCSVGPQCWERHRSRVRRLFPDIQKIEDEIVAAGVRGEEVLRLYAARIEALTGVKGQAPPVLCVMMGNTEDGASVAAGGEPKDREEATLRLPFES